MSTDQVDRIVSALEDIVFILCVMLFVLTADEDSPINVGVIFFRETQRSGRHDLQWVIDGKSVVAETSLDFTRSVPMSRDYQDRRVELTKAIVKARQQGLDLGCLLSNALGQAALQLGGTDELIAGRPSSWESDLVQQLTYIPGVGVSS